MKTWMAVLLLAVTVNAQEAVHEVLHNFSGPPDGALPNGSPVLEGATLYGTAAQAGSNGGVVFSISTNGLDYTILHSFSSNGTLTYNGRFPESTLLLTNGTLIGTTFYGGTNDAGVVFQLNTDGSNFQVLHTLGGPEGGNPVGTLADGGTALYGLTTGTAGTLYKINRDGSGLQILRSFDLSTTNGYRPTGAPLLHGSTLYATTANGGTGGVGCVFSITTNGLNFQLLHSFGGGTNGVTPAGYLALAGNTLFGTSEGGANGHGAVFSIRTNGTAFKLLHSFTSTDGRGPVGGVTVTGGKVFGLTSLGGTNDDGTAFMMNTDGTDFQLLHDFADLDGKNMRGSPVLAGNVLYGFGESGGNSINRGTIFSLTLTNGFTPGIEFDCTLTPALATNIIGSAHTVTATVTSNSLASVGTLVSFNVTGGPHVGQTGTATTDASGQGSFTYIGSSVGTDTIRAISLGVTGVASKVWISTNAPPVTHELAVIKMKAPKKITLSEKKPNIVSKFSVSIQNNGVNAEVIPDIGTLANLVTLNVQTLGGCTNPTAVLVTPKFGFPFHLAPKKKLTLAYTAVISCANAPAAGANDYDYLVTATVHASVLGGTDSVPANDVCPHVPFGTDKGCGNKTGGNVYIDVIVK